MNRYPLPFVVGTAWLATAALAQTTHFVGPGGFPQITNALAVAAPGDIVLVAPGSYGSVNSSIGVVIRAVTPGTVQVGLSQVSVPAQQSLHLVDLRLSGLAISGDGATTLDGCTTENFSLGVRVLSGMVHFQSCTIGAQGFSVLDLPALNASDATITAIDCTFHGANGSAQSPGPVGEGIRLQNCSFVGSNLTITGGSSWYTSTPSQPQLGPAAALRATSSSLWITDSSLTPGVLYGVSTPASCTVDASAGRLVRCQVTTGVCGGATTSGPGLGVHRPAAYQTPGQFTLDFRTTPGDFVALFANGEPGNTPLPILEQTLLLAPSTAVPIGLLPSDASGFATATWTLPAGLANRAWWVQGFSNFSLPIQASPLVGGLAR